MLLINKNVIITGGSQGIGEATCLGMAKEGANIFFTYRKHKKEAFTLRDKIISMGLKSSCVNCDISDFNEAKNVVSTATEFFKNKVDILVNNAGMNWDSVCWKMTEEQWDRVINVNLKGYFNFVRALSIIFKKQGFGNIINITSINGLRGKFGQSNYSASKAGIIGYTKSIAKELGQFGINANAVAPGLIKTKMLIESKYKEKIIKMALSEMALKSIGEPEDLANVIVFLASHKAKHITGEVIKVDGGQYI